MRSNSFIMRGPLDWVGALLPFLPVAIASANFPAIPSDKTTPVQQRLAISGANCKLRPVWRPIYLDLSKYARLG